MRNHRMSKKLISKIENGVPYTTKFRRNNVVDWYTPRGVYCQCACSRPCLRSSGSKRNKRAESATGASEIDCPRGARSFELGCLGSFFTRHSSRLFVLPPLRIREIHTCFSGSALPACWRTSRIGEECDDGEECKKEKKRGRERESAREEKTG